MNAHLTEIAYLLDRSGSMEPMREAAVTAFNDFLRVQLEVPGDARLTLVQFDDAYEIHADARPLQDVSPLTAATYQPRGSTALLDAIGRTILDFDRRLAALSETEQPGKVIFAIFTDGQENASREFTHPQIGDLIRQHREARGWEFLFLAANQDAIATAAAMQMDTHLSGKVCFSLGGVKSTGSAMGRKVRAMRMKSSGTMDAQACVDDALSLNEIAQQEQDKPET